MAMAASRLIFLGEIVQSIRSGPAGKGAMKMEYEAPEKEVCKIVVEGGGVGVVGSENMGTAAPAGLED